MPMSNKRPIDRVRDSAVQMIVGSENDSGQITDMIVIDGTMHIVKESGIYVCKLADQIDPQRTNVAVPNIQQKVLSCGSGSELVSKTLLTAKKLFNRNYLQSFDCEVGISLAFKALRDLTAMQEILVSIQNAENAAHIDDRRQKDRSIVLPTINALDARCKEFVQKSDHSLQSLLAIMKLFYGEASGKRWFGSLAQVTAEKHGVDDQFVQFLNSALPLMQFTRNLRNCIEHPKHDQRVVVADFSLNAEMIFQAPTIEVIHAETPQPPVQLSTFMTQMIEQLSGAFELVIAFACQRHIEPSEVFPIDVVELPESLRGREKHVRFSYGVRDGDRIIPAG
jgi:hypothetical protein